jgi:TolA-binding protein
MSYVRLRQFSDALSVLKQMENWPGTSEQHARVLFLIGWIQLQNSNKPKALFAFRVVVDKFPQTLYAKTAGQLIRRMEGF